MPIALHARRFDTHTLPYIQHISDLLGQENMPLCLSPAFDTVKSQLSFPASSTHALSPENISQCQAMISLGGDGTLLEALTYVAQHQIPILGINTGRLGFLTHVPKDNIEHAITRLLHKQYTLDNRTLLLLQGQEHLFRTLNFALNEFAVFRRDVSSMINITCHLDNRYLGTFWADGFMVATPTGSTAYSLSCGGPVITPQSQSFLITPINSHNLSARTMIVPDSSHITLQVQSKRKKFLASLDARSTPVSPKTTFSIKKAPFLARLIQFQDYHFFDTLREKLRWGVDART